MEGFLSKKEKAAKADNRLIMKFGKQRWRVKLYLTDILELIINSLDQRSFPEHNLVMLKHQGILHTLFQTRDEVDSVNEELFEEVFRDIAPVSEELAEDPFVKVYVFQGSSVVHVARSEEKIKQFPLVIDDQMKFESIEPTPRVPFLFRVKSLKVLCCLSLLIWQLRIGVESIKDIPVPCPKVLILRETARKTQTFRSNSINRL